MIDQSDSNANPNALPNPLNKVRDVADFQTHWSEFRPIADRLAHSRSLSPAEADTLAWMIELLDRIGPQDLKDGVD